MRSRRPWRGLPVAAKKFVLKYFEEQNASGKRADPDDAHRLLLANDSIEPEDRMSLEQIRSLYSRLSSTKRTSKQIRQASDVIDDSELGETDEEPEEWAEECEVKYSGSEELLAEDDLIYQHLISMLDQFFELA